MRQSSLPASIPEDVAIHQNTVDIGPDAAGALGETCARQILPVRARNASSIRPESVPRKVWPFPSDWMPCAQLTVLKGMVKFLETVAAQAVESKGSAGQKRAVGSFAKCRNRRDRNPLRRPKRLETIPVVAENAVFRAHPNEAPTVLVDLPHREVVEPFRASEGAKTIFLRAKRPAPAAGRSDARAILVHPTPDNIVQLIQSISLPHIRANGSNQ